MRRRRSRRKPRIILWKHLYLGFEATEFKEERLRKNHIRSTRKAIEEMFTPRALRRWTSARWKRAMVDPGLDIADALASLVQSELEKGVQQDDVSFRTEGHEALVGVRKKNRRALTKLEPDIKPEGTLCWYCGEDCWLDCCSVPVLIQHGNKEKFHAFRPDGRHEVTATLVFDCPFAPTEKLKALR